MGQVRFGICPAIQADGLNVHILSSCFGRQDRKILPVLEVDHCFFQLRRTEHVNTAGRIHGIKAHRAEYIPGTHLSAVFITCIAGRFVIVQLVHDPGRIQLGLPGLSRIIVEIRRMVAGLIAVGVLAYKSGSVPIDVPRFGFQGEEGIELGNKGVLASDQVDQVGYILGNIPEILPCIP